MSWQRWADQLRQAPEQAVTDLLRGATDVAPFERLEPYEFLLAVLPRTSRLVSRALLGEPPSPSPGLDPNADLPALVDAGLSAWLLAKRQAAPPPARKLGAYSAQVCEALQWPLYFALPQTCAALQAERVQWLQWLGSLTLSAYRDPEYEYWQVLAAHQDDDGLQFFWQSFVGEAGRLRSRRYLNLGLLALARLPLSDEDSLRNLRLQVQTLVNRYQRRKGWGTPAQEELADSLRGVMARNPSLSADNYRAFLTDLLSPLGDDTTASVLSLLGLAQTTRRHGAPTFRSAYRLQPPASADATDEAVQAVRRSGSLAQAWQAIHRLLSAHEAYLHQTGDAYYFVRSLDKCTRALCKKYSLREPEIQARLFQWIHLALRIDAEDPRLWMLWQLALRQADQAQRARWVLWEMTRRFPEQLPCRVELARLLADSRDPTDQAQTHRLLQQVLLLDPDNLHAHSTLAQLAIRRWDWDEALKHARRGLRIDPSDEASALLLATAHARRNGPGDLQTAIEDLQRFVTRYLGNLRAEDYLRYLLQRQQAQDQPLANENDEDTVIEVAAAQPESDPTWRVFADSVRSWAASSDPACLAATSADADRVLPLPQALRQAVALSQWDADVLDHYDAATAREFPLETRLWRYLQTLQSASSSEAERARARQTVQAWLEAEKRYPGQDNPSWLPYLHKHWEAMNASTAAALTDGAEWLKDLLDRYQTLPAPLFT
ncbi:tetratricopeptide repeat protein [Accumulibacter sp.]|uniref:tetratricopeptide repeat protein n=1 Tax=Accumulibacter sp. TaxID=2053492 RepID=UPI0035B1B23B